MSDANSPPPSPLRIFVVENHADTLKYLCLFLEQLGHSVRSARSVAEALATWPEAHCEVLISDIGLPDGDGYELLLKLGPPRPIYAIAMSGFGMNSDRARSRAAGFRHHLLKPFEPDELDPMLEEAARLARSSAA
jgi:two-component system CheB/CheR fusion protein